MCVCVCVCVCIVTAYKCQRWGWQGPRRGRGGEALKQWSDQFLLHLLENVEDVLYFWKHSMVLDIGECLTILDEFLEQEKLTGAWWKQLVVDAVAGPTPRRGTAPLDCLKVFMQIHASKTNQLNILGAFGGSMIQERGVHSLWRSNVINLLKIAPESAIKFMAYEQIKQAIQGQQETAHAGVLCGWLPG